MEHLIYNLRRKPAGFRGRTLLIAALICISSCLISQQEEEQPQEATIGQHQTTPPRGSWGRLIEDEEERIVEIEIRRPEDDLVPRTETEEIVFSLNFIRRRLMESNRQLY